jgi:hypothetical protein
MVAEARRHGWTFPYLHDETQGVARAYFAACRPPGLKLRVPNSLLRCSCGRRRAALAFARRRHTICGSIWRSCAASWRTTRRATNHLLTKAGMGYRIEGVAIPGAPNVDLRAKVARI